MSLPQLCMRRIEHGGRNLDDKVVVPGMVLPVSDLVLHLTKPRQTYPPTLVAVLITNSQAPSTA